jgi:hypothetical protein
VLTVWWTRRGQTWWRSRHVETRRLPPTGWPGAEARVISIRGGYVPLIDVGLALGYRAEPLPAGQGVALLIEGEGGARAALLVDAIQGQRQVVIKSLEANYRQVPGVAAATILGDGRAHPRHRHHRVPAAPTPRGKALGGNRLTHDRVSPQAGNGN